MVLDEARDLLINRYGLVISDPRLSDQRPVAEKQRALRELVRVVHSKLNTEDAALLSGTMIFRGKNAVHTVRQEGNAVAFGKILTEPGLGPLPVIRRSPAPRIRRWFR